MKPLGNRVVVQPDEVPTRTEGGVELPDATLPISNRGTVVAVGPGRYGSDGERIPIDVEVGDYVFFDVRGQVPGITVNGKHYVVLYDNQVAIALEESEKSNPSSLELLIN